MRTLLLYTTLGCHLCETAERMILGQAPGNLSLEKVEISTSEALMARYGLHIPVIRFEGGEDELGWPFDDAALAEFLDSRLQGS